METCLASVADASALEAVHRASFGAAAWNTAQISESLSLPTTRGWVMLEQDLQHELQSPLPLAGRGNRPLGFILSQFAQDEVEILTFCVIPAARRRGIARRLLALVLAEARAQKTHKIFLEVAADNSAAITLYEKSGFIKTSTRRNYYERDGRKVGALMLALEVG